jgi:hypothetical protein
MHEFELFRGGEYRKKLSGSKWSEAHAFLKQTLLGLREDLAADPHGISKRVVLSLEHGRHACHI